MTPEEHREAARLFDEACELDPSETGRFLDRACTGKPELREMVESLLVSHAELVSSDRDVSSKSASKSGPAGELAADPDENTIRIDHSKLGLDPYPEVIGPYTILEVLGEGGMGVVYLAEQREPVRRRVALKLIKLGMDTKEVVARFESERQALALMDHPHIARVYDAGATDDGRPYFVMEHVKGVPLDEYCARHKLSMRERLELFMQVCHGVQHAHHRGIIHRDLKPSNILVFTPDEGPIAKIIDFGVAKATNQRLTEKTLYTELGRVIGTPAYMSPEQAEMTGEGIDTRTDIYSLGVLFYELIVGQLPLELDVRSIAFDEIVRRIREEDPPAPSTRWSRLNVERSTTLAAQRHTTRAGLSNEIRGDLDWITMKAMEKDRNRRYSTAAEFAADIARHLSDEPVMASPPSVAYRMQKFYRKNRGPVTAAAAVIALLIVGLVVTGYLYTVADEAKEEARGQTEVARGALAAKNQALEEVLRLSDIERLKDYLAAAEELWPSVPETVTDMEAWLEKAEDLAGRLDEHRATLTGLREQALPYDDAARARDRETHPRAGKVERWKKSSERLLADAAKIEASDAEGKATVLSYGEDRFKKHPTYYFRRDFNVMDPGAFEKLTLRLVVDDSAVVYLNGLEILRVNLPEGAIKYDTLASESVMENVGEDYEFESHGISTEHLERLREGENVLAVEVHPASPRSSDLYFDLELMGLPKDGDAVALISRGSTWRYHDRGVDLKESWRAPNYDDSGWGEGPGPLGYKFKKGRGLAIEKRQLAALFEKTTAELEAEVSKRRTWRFSDTELEWQHGLLTDLVKGLEAFTNPDPQQGAVASMKERLQFARTVKPRTVDDHRAAWDRALRSIADREESPKYDGLRIKPQVGLIPIGPDPDSGLWEFVHLQTGDTPERDEVGKLVLTEEMGLVFVLIPGGTFTMGATRPTLGTYSGTNHLGVDLTERDGGLGIDELPNPSAAYAERSGVELADSLATTLGIQPGDVILSINDKEMKAPEELTAVFEPLRSGDSITIEFLRAGERRSVSGRLGPNIDPNAGPGEFPLEKVNLDPFFLSKFEMTQAQWLHFAGENPSKWFPEMVSVKFPDKVLFSLQHPVESVSWDMCTNMLRKLDLVVPTEAQWEYAARAGTVTVWWTGNDRESLRGKVNLADQSAAVEGAKWVGIEDWPDLDDGYAYHAPVGTYAANLFGLHEVHGNVWEWCRKPGGYGHDAKIRISSRTRVVRGGSFASRAGQARSAYSNTYSPEYRAENVGLRPVREVAVE